MFGPFPEASKNPVAGSEVTKYLPEYDSKIVLKKTNIELTKSKSEHTANLKGLIKINNNFDDFHIKIIDFEKSI